MEPPTLLDLLALDEVAHRVLGYTDPIALARLQSCGRATRNIEELGAAWRQKLEAVLWGSVWHWTDVSDLASDSDYSTTSDGSSSSDEEEQGGDGAGEAAGGEQLPEVLLHSPGGATAQQLRVACQLAARGEHQAACLDWANLFRCHGVAKYLPHARRLHLEQSLRQRGLKLRSDSWVCKQYIAGTGRMDFEGVCDKVEEMSFFYQSGVFSVEKCHIGINAWSLPSLYMTDGFAFGQILYELRCCELPRELEQMVDDSTTLGEDSPLRHSSARFTRWAQRTLVHEQSEVAKHRIVCLVTTASDQHPYPSEFADAWDEYCKRWGTDRHKHADRGPCSAVAASAAASGAAGGAAATASTGHLEQPRTAPVALAQDQPARMLRAAPLSVHANIRAWALSCPWLRYEQLTDEGKAARRMDLAERYAAANRHTERMAAPHIAAIRSYAADAMAHGTPLSLPPGMDAELRARLHEFAEEVDLEHFSVGAKAHRRLTVFPRDIL